MKNLYTTPDIRISMFGFENISTRTKEELPSAGVDLKRDVYHEEGVDIYVTDINALF